MKYLILSITLILALIGNAQESAKNRLVLKVKEAYQSRCTSDGINDDFIKNTLLASDSRIEKTFPNHQITVTRQNDKIGADLSCIYTITSPSEKIAARLVKRLNQSSIIAYCEFKPILYTSLTPSDTNLNNQPYLNQIKALQAWDINTGSAARVIAIIDTGTDLDHPDLIANMYTNSNDPINGIDDDQNGYIDDYNGWNFVENNHDLQATLSEHGVHVAGIAAATTNNTTGVAGVGFDTRFMTVRVGENRAITHGYEGIVYAADQGADIINCSWGGNSISSFAQDVIEYAVVNKDALVVAAAGNSNTNQPFYPAAYDYCLAVGSVNSDDAKSSFSNFGFWVDIMAPGAGIYNTVDGGGYGNKNGTSMASPVVAGAAAIVRAEYPGLSAMQIAERIKTTADDISTAGNNATLVNQIGSGRLNLLNALSGNIINPGIVLSDIVLTDNNDNVPVEGDTIYMTAKFTNYLNDAPNSVARLFIEAGTGIQLLNDQVNLGDILSLTQTDNLSNPFSFRVNDNAPLSEQVTLRIEVESGSYYTNHFIETIIAADYINIEPNELASTITSKGLIGYNAREQNMGIGLSLNGSSSLMYESSLMIGGKVGANTFVVDQARSSTSTFENDFQTVQRATLVPAVGDTVHLARASFDDTQSLNDHLGVTVNQQSVGFNYAGHQNYFLLEYEVINTSGQFINDLNIGLFVDFDIASFNSNRTAQDLNRQVMYTYSPLQNAPVAGVQALGTSSYNVNGLDNIDGGAGGINLWDGFNSIEKYNALINVRGESGMGSADGNDVCQVVAINWGNLAPNDTATATFAVIAASNQVKFLEAADSAFARYNGELPSSIQSTEVNQPLIFPNPTSQKTTLVFPDHHERNIQLHSMTGQLLLTKNCSACSIVELNTSELNNGVYILTSSTKFGKQSQRLIVAH